ncbi:MAG: type II secretion system protein [Vampirovibrio sp.]|nr:type II secretion system protein [Vampirovibrio sp.]
MRLTVKTGFTLSELLVGLGIIGLIAAFAVPKVLHASGAALANAKVHKAAQAVVNGYEKWQQNNSDSLGMTGADLMTFVNYSSLITDGRKIDIRPNDGRDFTCTTTLTTTSANLAGPCYQMPDGSMVYFMGHTGVAFTASNTSELYFGVDPDAVATSDFSQANDGVATNFMLYKNGRLRERGHLKGGSFAGQPQSTPNYYRQ